MTITGTPVRVTTGRDLMLLAATAIEPLLNRVVFSGRHVAEYLTNDALVVCSRSNLANGETLHLLSTISLDRLATDLQRLGLARTKRSATGDQWLVGDQVTLDVTQIASDQNDSLGTWLEYAALLTLSVRIGEGETGLTVRISGAPALLALDWQRFSAGGESPLDSADIEEIIGLVAGRADLAQEVRYAPPELRAFVAHETSRFLRYDGAEHVIRAALPGANRPVAMVRRVLERLHAIVA